MSVERYLVTGASGFIGRRLVRHLANAGNEVLAIVGPSSAPAPVVAGVTSRSADIRNTSAVEHCFSSFRPTRVIHLAAAGLLPGDAAIDVMAINIQGTYNVLSAAADSGSVDSLVATGSWFEYGPAGNASRQRPSSVYGLSKYAATKIARSFAVEGHLPVMVLRPFQVYGPEEPEHRLIPQAIAAATARRHIQLRNPSVGKDWIYVDDVVEALHRASSIKGAGEVIDVGTGVLTSVHDVANLVMAEAGFPAGADVKNAPEATSDQAITRTAVTEDAETLLGWRAVTKLRSGIAKTVAASLE